jgi:glucose-1-phosphate cytidylyltransferase
VEPFLDGEAMFLANYSDGLSDFPLPTLIDAFARGSAVGTFLAVRPNYSFHFVSREPDGTVLGVDNVIAANAWINGGFFVFRRTIFSYMRPGEELVEEPFQRLIAERKLSAHDYEGFWRCLDTFKDLQALETLYAQGTAPWEVWQNPTRRDGPPARSLALGRAPQRRRLRRTLVGADSAAV